MVALLDDMW